MNVDKMMYETCIVIAIFIVVIFGAVLYSTYQDMFRRPYVTVNFNISNKRQPVYDDYIDEWIMNLPNNKADIQARYEDAIERWEKKYQNYINKSIFWKQRRIKLYTQMRNEILQDDYPMFRFVFVRNQTRYHQVNYQRCAYIARNEDRTMFYTLEKMLAITDELQDISYETTRTKWKAKNQRSLMTKELRQKIKIRDNYTCQICGKYMPDEVGLHVDHIIPIKRGGKTIESNLQVLCDKCNLRKSSKL